ncbi:unnamed protein product [Dicrocoelium dendriticum]|nr:unnamed protein product [Dicrocoelium dendriticum]
MSEYACHPSNNWLDNCGFRYEDTVFDLESERRLSSTQNAAKFHLPYSLHEASIKGFLPTFAKRTFQCRALPTSWLWTLESRHGVYCGIFHTSSNLFFSGSHDGVHVFDYSSRYLRLLEAIRCPDSHWAVVSLNLSPDDRHLVYSVLSNHVHLVNITGTHFIDQTIDIGDLSGQTYSVCFNGAGTHLIAGQENGNLSLCDIETGSWSSILASPSRQDINAVATVDPAGQVIIAAGDDTNIRVSVLSRREISVPLFLMQFFPHISRWKHNFYHLFSHYASLSS